MINIRRATLQDIDALLDIGERFVLSCQNFYPSPDRSATAQSIMSSFHHTAPMAWFVAEENGILIGMAFVIASRWIWSHDIQAELRFSYVEPEKRGGTSFYRLMDAVQEWSVSKNAREISFTIATGNADEDERLAETLQKRGWKNSGVNLVKEL